MPHDHSGGLREFRGNALAVLLANVQVTQALMDALVTHKVLAPKQRDEILAEAIATCMRPEQGEAGLIAADAIRAIFPGEKTTIQFLT